MPETTPVTPGHRADAGSFLKLTPANLLVADVCHRSRSSKCGFGFELAPHPSE
jgi:hypothetical protein